VAARTSDGELVAAALAGSQEAFGELAARYRDAVFGVAFHRLGDFEAARDAAQETFVKAFLTLANLRNPAAFSAWIRRVADGTAVDFARRPRREIPSEIEAAIAPDPPEGATAGSVREALQTLSGPTQRALILHHLGGYSHAEVAQSLGIAPGALKTRLSRAKARLRQEMIAMVQDTLKMTVTLFLSRITVHGKRGSNAFGMGTERPLDAEQARRVAEMAYDLACLDPDLVREPGWRARLKEAAAAIVRTHLDGAIRNGTNAVSMSLEKRETPGAEPHMVLHVDYTAPGGGTWGWTGPDVNWMPLRRQLARMAGVRLSRTSQPVMGAFTYPFGNRNYLVRVALAPKSARIRLQQAKRVSSGAGARAAPRAPADTVTRIARTILEQAVGDDANAIAITVGRARSRIEVRCLVGDEWKDLMRFEGWIEIKPAQPGRRMPIPHPLWQPLRDRLAEMAGIKMRPRAVRQAGRIDFAFQGKRRDLRVSMTKTAVRIEIPTAEP